LDKKSLQLALLSLIQDDRFLDLLHSQYLRVVHARVKKHQQEQNNGSS
jgi:mRNA-decapping enzyme 1B